MQEAQEPRKGPKRSVGGEVLSYQGAESEVPRREIVKQQQGRGRKDRKGKKTERGYFGHLAPPQGTSSGFPLNRPHQMDPIPLPHPSPLFQPQGPQSSVDKLGRQWDCGV